MAYILSETQNTYFDLLPPEINLLITSKISDEDLYKHVEVLIYNTYKEILDENTWRDLFILRYPEEYTFIINLRKIVGTASWQNKFLFYLTSYLELKQTHNFPSHEGYITDTFNLYIIKKWYPKFYQEISHINLDNPGIVRTPHVKKTPYLSKWYTVLYWILSFDDYGIFNGIHNEQYSDIYEHPINMINNMFNTSDNFPAVHYIVMLIIYVENKHKNPRDIKLSALFYLFSSNITMYKDVIKRVIKSLPNPNDTDYKTLLRSRSGSDVVIDLFTKDIRDRLIKSEDLKATL